jgi:hypothetical protein
VKENQSLKETQCIEDMKEIHGKIEAILKDNIDKFNQFFEEIIAKEK